MEIFTILIVSLIFVAAILYFYKGRRSRRNYPPGPPGYPFIGHMLHLSPDKTISSQLTRFVKEYGPIFSLEFGKYSIIVLSDAALIRDSFNDPIFNGRPNNKIFRSLALGHYGILSIDGQNWSEQRRFTVQHLKEFGFGKNHMENLIQEEAKLLIDNFKADEGKSIELSRRFNLAIVNSLWMIMTGSRLEHDDAYLNEVLDNLFKRLNEVFCQSVLSFIPELATFFPKRSGWNSLVNAIDKVAQHIESIVVEHENTLTEGEPRDFIDVYLNEINRTGDKESNFYKEKGRQNLVSIILDLFAAGAETTSATMNWSVFYLVMQPEIQKKLQTEIDVVIGQSRLPSLADRPNMPYTEAVILEILRHSSIADLGLFHTALEDTKLAGYDIPKGTFILANFWYVHRDPKHWTDPNTLNPDRFLSEDKASVLKKDNLTPFSIGRRTCIGESLAKDEIFLFLTCLFQRFDIRLDSDKTSSSPPSYEPQNTFILKPQEFFVIMHDRTTL